MNKQILTLSEFLKDVKNYNIYIHVNLIQSNEKPKNVSSCSSQFETVEYDKTMKWLIFRNKEDSWNNLKIYSPIISIKKEVINSEDCYYYFSLENCETQIKIHALYIPKGRTLDSVRKDVINSLNFNKIDYKNYILYSESITNENYFATLYNKDTNNCMLIESETNIGSIVVRKF